MDEKTNDEVLAMLNAFEVRLESVDQLNQTLLAATSAYQIRMARQEMTIYEQDERIKDLKAGNNLLSALNTSQEQSIAMLNERSLMLTALESAGVDNWQGYSHAFEILDEWKEEDATS